ncbi:hypothetical protein DNTS_000638 [Danionella cerebrum]|uniref:AAA+ ATPase domain-containing protein n=1 Tax=Danionella cerebrum TaxID=2873325 RepID=A0A553PUP0_9TELE|nr:hypothetical protein DNTS_000638 [Danionella translucida]
MSSSKGRNKGKKRLSEGEADRSISGEETDSGGGLTVTDFIERAEDKAPPRWRPFLAQMSVNSMKNLNICIGRPVLISSISRHQEVCVAWPASQFPARRVSLHVSVQSSLGVRPGDRVSVQPITGALQEITHLQLRLRPEDRGLNTEEFRGFLLRSLEGRVLLPGGALTLSFLARDCVLTVESLLGVDGETLSAQTPDASTPLPLQISDGVTRDLSSQLEELSIHQSTPERSHDLSPLTPSPAPSGVPLSPFSEGSFSSSSSFYRVGSSTALSLSESGLEDEDQKEGELGSKVTYSMIGGLRGQLQVIRETLELPLRHPELFRSYGVPPPRGVLLYGPPGTGKTMIGRAVANEVGAHMTVINGPEIMSKFYGETEAKLRQIFSEAALRQPAVIFIDELDALCPRREGAQNEVEKRVVATLLTLMDGIGSEAHSGRVLVLGATNRPHALDPALRRPGRFDKELEVSVPGAEGRMEILQALLSSTPRRVSEEDLRDLADAAHGYVGADLAAVCKEAGERHVCSSALRGLLGQRWWYMLCGSNLLQSLKLSPSQRRIDSESFAQQETSLPHIAARIFEACKIWLHALRRALGSASTLTDAELKQRVKVTASDLRLAMAEVKPSAMREVAIDVPKVRWSDVAGLERVKLALRQAVEWPLRHPEVFVRMGIAPPRGILLYGPPGCCKTMIAQALANESQLNFLSVKGPELLSKFVGESERGVREVSAALHPQNISSCFFILKNSDSH